jgi:large conductance mechanosensitive channel
MGALDKQSFHMLNEFKAFLLRGNVVDLAVGVVVGAAFGSVVNGLVADFITPFIAAVAKAPDFGSMAFTINGSRFAYGHFLNALISFFLVATAIFFFVVKPMNILNAHTHKKPADSKTKKCPECLSEIPVAARRCSECTQKIA